MSAPACTDRLCGIVTANDIRGRADEELTEEVARALGAAFADHLEGQELIVAHDMRVSSPRLARAFAEGAVRRGSAVAFAGLSSTDQLYCASGLHHAAGAMITASHNPAADNGIKLCTAGARPVGRDTGLREIAALAEEHLAADALPEQPGGRCEEIDTLADYVDTVCALVPVPTGRPLRVVVDAANAMAGLTMPAVAERLPSITVVPLHFRLDGTFPHHRPDPLDLTTLTELQQAVVAEGADLGLAFDGDADRCVVIDERGRPVSPSAITALIAQGEIARARAAGVERPAVVANCVSSRHVGEAIEQAGGTRIRSRVGHALIKALMAQHDAVFGGEHSAHYYFRDFFYADSGMIAALHVLAALAAGDGPLSALVAAHDPYASSGELNSRCPDAPSARQRVRETLQARYGSALTVDELDGLTLEHWDDAETPAERWWLSLRSSNTESLLRLNVEAAEEETMRQVRDEVLRIIADDAPAGGGPAVSGADVPPWVRQAMRCPICRAELVDAPSALECTGCGRRYEVSGAIPVLIAAEPGGAGSADAEPADADRAEPSGAQA